MEVILLEKIRKLGDLGKQVRVKPGYGRNYLIPKGKAVPATAENIAKFEAMRAELEKAQSERLEAARTREDRLQGLVVTISQRTASEGKLYGSVGTVDIADAVTAAGIEIAKQEVRLPDGPFRAIGEYEVPIQLHADVEVIIKLNIIPEGETE